MGDEEEEIYVDIWSVPGPFATIDDKFDFLRDVAQQIVEKANQGASRLYFRDEDGMRIVHELLLERRYAKRGMAIIQEALQESERPIGLRVPIILNEDKPYIGITVRTA